ncbi:MAG: hypothetical protein WCI54_00100 [Bacteroidia bacterium]|jgi:hypothetical protein
MKKLAMVLAMAFTMGLAVSTVSASTKDDKTKAKTECTATEKKACCKDAKAGCSKDAKAETPKKDVK